MAYSDPDGGGVGGWLALLVLILAAFRPLALIFSAYTNLYGDPQVALAYGAAWRPLQLFEWLLVATTIAGCWFVAWRLNSRPVWRSVKIAIAGIWILSLGYQLADTIGVALIGNIPVALLFGAVVPAVVQSVVFSLVWSAYLLKSKRVANTYLRHDEAEVAQVFG
jgi:hypothetical protein